MLVETVVSMFYGITLLQHVTIAWGRLAVVDFKTSESELYVWRTIGTNDWDIHIARAIGFHEPWYGMRAGRLAWVEIPLWIPGVLAGILGWKLGRRRKLPHLCRTCGYDLTLNISGVCPECGKEIL